MSIGVVVIGRNEGERLRKCLQAISGGAHRVVYVDSGSTDGSVEFARGIGLDVVELDMQRPFTAARARNEGGYFLSRHAPDIQYVQFVDGDCEIAPGWLDTATAFLDSQKNVAMVCGRLRELHPENSIYNQLCDNEWNTAIGESKACGGIAMLRLSAFESVQGYRADLIAGEESELCVRLRAQGWQIWRLDAEMAWHDAAMTQFRQWWKRTVRTGYAYAEGAHLHGSSPELHRIKETRRIWIWGVGVPLVTTFLIFYIGIAGLATLLIYPAQIMRIALLGTKYKDNNWLRAIFLVIGKFPEAIGQLKFVYNRLSHKTANLIEYK